MDHEMATNPSQIPLSHELHHVDNLSRLKQAMTDNPQAVMDYIMRLRGESEAARRDLNDTKKELMRIHRPKSSRTFEQRTMEQEQKETIVAELPSTRGVLEPLSFVIVVSFFFLITFSNILYGIPPWSPQFELIRKNCLTATMWHWIIPFSFILFLFTIGCMQSYSYTKISPTDNQKDNSRLGIKKRAAQFASGRPYPLNGPGEEMALHLTQLFADYVGIPQAGSPFSRWYTIGKAYAMLLDSLILCCFPFITWQKGGREDVSCVGHWAKGGLMLAVLALGLIAWLQGIVTGWYFGMEGIAKRLRRECLRKGAELEQGEGGDRERLEALVREILQEVMVREKEKDAETLASEKVVIDSIVKRIRC